MDFRLYSLYNIYTDVRKRRPVIKRSFNVRRINQLYFYKKTIAPDNYDFYNHSTGVAGFKKLQTKMGECIFSGTIEEMEAYYKEQREKQPKRGYDIY